MPLAQVAGPVLHYYLGFNNELIFVFCSIVHSSIWQLVFADYCLWYFAEHIITFDDYFSESKRYSFVLAALGSNYSWQILTRYNVLTNLPSDFDVIRVDTFYVL